MSWIDQGKLAPPSLPPGYLPRCLLPTNTSARVVSVVAGPGYGKTLALQALADQAQANGCWTAWLTADALDLDASTVFEHLVAAVQAVIPQFDPGPTRLATGDAQDHRRWWQRFFATCAAYDPQPGLWLLLDDLHHWEAGLPGLLASLRPFLERLPLGLHLAMASRTPLPLGLGKLAVRGDAIALGPDALRFSSAEAGHLFAGLGAPVEVAGAACAQLDGWPLGLGLMAARGGALLAAKADLRAYVAEEYIEAFPSDWQALLPLAALIEPFTAAALGAVLGVEDPPGLLGRLEAAHLVTGREDGAYRLPGFLAISLREAAEGQLVLKERQALHRRAAAHFAEQGRTEDAMGHWVKADAWVEAEKELCSWAPELLARGRQAVLARWLEAFPGEATPWLAYWRAQLAWRAGEHALAAAGFARALSGFDAAGDGEGAFKARLRLFTHAVVHEDAAGILRWQALLAPDIDRASVADRADWGLVRAHEAELRGDLEAWAACNREVLALPVDANVEVATCATFARLNLYNLAQHQGDWAAAHAHAEAAEKLADAWRLESTRLYSGFMRTYLWTCEGRPGLAEAWMRELPAEWEEGLDWHDRGCALTAQGAWCLARGEEERAERLLMRALGVFSEAGMATGKKVPIERLMWLAVLRRQPARLARWREEAGALGNSFYDLAVRLAHARGLDVMAQPGAAAAFQSLVADSEAVGANFLLARSRLYQAACRLREGDRSGALAAYAAAQALIEAHGYGFLREQNPDLWAELAPLILPAPPLAGPTLRLRLLGGFEVWADGVRLDHWPRRKAQVMLAALVLHPRGLSAFELGGLMAQPPEGVQNCASSLRRVLEPGLKAGAASRFLRLEQDRYRLMDGVQVLSDLQTFDAAVAASKAPGNPSSAVAAHTEALGVYGGALLDAAVFEGAFDAEREACQAQALAACAWLVDWHGGRAEEAEAARWCEHALALAPCDEASLVRALRHFGVRRQAEKVRAAYWDHRKALKLRLGLAPGPEVEAAYRDALAMADRAVLGRR